MLLIVIYILIFHFPLFLSEEQCGLNHFHCKNSNNCLSEENVCDGRGDCLDASDETAELCQPRKCRVTEDDFESLSSFTIYDLISGSSGTYFRCNYGACIPHFYTCNGLIDCFDSSDETEELCSKTKCPRNNFRCNYGGCISRNKRCNGMKDCIDGSDETSKLCQRNRCRLKYFQCDYGACIFGRKKCNGKRDCADGSDETAATCGANHVVNQEPSSTQQTVVSSSKNPPTTPSTSTTTTSTASTSTITSTDSTSTTTSTASTSTTSSTASTATTTTPTTTVITTTTTSTDTATINTTMATSTDTTIAIVKFPEVTTSTESETSLKDLNSANEEETNSTQIISDESLLCDEHECLCPPPYNFCVFCTQNTNIEQVCKDLAEEVFCSLSSVENVAIEIISCGKEVKSKYDFIKIPLDFQRSNNEQCGTEVGVPENTLVYLDCWGESSDLFLCKADGLWHRYEAQHYSQPFIEICQETTTNPNVCGKLPPTRPTYENEKLHWPFLVSIFDGTEFLCLGTLVASQWILTSSQCLPEPNIKKDPLRGYTRLQNNSLQIKFSLWKEELKMPKISFAIYNGKLVLMKLEIAVKLSEKLVPACLGHCDQEERNIYSLTGASFLVERVSPNRRGVNFHTKTADEGCFKSCKNCPLSSNVKPDEFCSKSFGSADVPAETLGGPYFVNSGKDHHERWTLQGIFSHSFKDENSSKIFVFTLVCHYMSWIESCINKSE
ncbi:UNVERIFIED_CONTAM: hypothetical protein RMT77_001335 [Armadillidium vulgare]